MVLGNKRRSGLKSWLVIVVLLIIALGVCFLVWNVYFRDSTDDNSKDKSVDVAKWADDGDNDNNDDVVSVEEEQVEKKKVVQYEGGDPNLTEELSGVVSYAGKSGDNVIIRVIIDQYLGEGSCVLELVNNDTVVYDKETSVVPMVSTSSCDGFDIPLSELSSGLFGITIKVKSGEKTGVILGEINV